MNKVKMSVMAAMVFAAGLAMVGAAEEKPAAGGTENQRVERGVITMASLLDDMTDLAAMAEFPASAYSCKQFSSSDRASTSPKNAETWFANDDAGQYLRVEKDKDGQNEYVLMEAQGPGAIVRIWCATPWGTVRIYLDGAETPAFEGSLGRLLGGRNQYFPAPIAGRSGGASVDSAPGYSLYIPIPYAKSCKVTSDASGLCYHVNYRTYPADTKVVSFSTAQLPALAPQLKKLAATLAASGKDGALPADAKKHPVEVSLAPAASAKLGSFQGAAAIRQFGLQWTPTADRDEKALRAVMLEMTFDGETTVRVPLGDFFGAGPGVNPYDSLPLQVAKDGRMTSRWVMPFKTSAEVKVVNSGTSEVALKGEIVTVPYAFGDATMLFHATWRRENDVPTEPKRDWNYLSAKGKGVFVGAALSIDNPVKQWWGEGDEKIYVDGETFPGWFGTGTADYFGHAWGSIALFTHAYHNQTRCDANAKAGGREPGGNAGQTCVNRFHILDRIPFTKDFRFDMELWHNANGKVNLSVIDYWYGAPGATETVENKTK